MPKVSGKGERISPIMYPGAELQHPYINFGPMQDQEEVDKETMPPALPPKRSSRSHPGSFRSEGIYFWKFYSELPAIAKDFI